MGLRDAMRPMTGAIAPRQAAIDCISSHAELRIRPSRTPGWRCAHRVAMRPPVEWPMRTIGSSSRSDRMISMASPISSS